MQDNHALTFSVFLLAAIAPTRSHRANLPSHRLKFLPNRKPLAVYR